MKRDMIKYVAMIGIIIAVIIGILYGKIKKVDLRGTVYSKENGFSIIVDKEEKDFLKGHPGLESQPLHVSVPDNINLDDYNVGDHVCIEFDGGVLESSPPQIKANTIRKE